MAGAPLTPEEQATYHQSKQPVYYGALGAFLVINNVAIISRVWINVKLHFRSKGFLIEDVFMIISWAIFNGVAANLLAGTSLHGLGLHVWTINAKDEHWPYQLAKAVESIWVTMVSMSGLLASVKIGLLFFYRRLFLVSKSWLRVAWWANLVYVILWFFGATFFYIFQCSPVQWYWMRYYPLYKKPTPDGMEGACAATSTIHVAIPMILNLLSDVAILLLPVSVIVKLHLDKRKKIGLLTIFCIGLLACVVELARIIDLTVGTSDKIDLTYGATNFLILTVAEETAVVVCACLPVIFPNLFRKSKQDSAIRKSQYDPHGNSIASSWRRSRMTRGFLRFDKPTSRFVMSPKNDLNELTATTSNSDMPMESLKDPESTSGSSFSKSHGSMGDVYRDGTQTNQQNIRVFTDIQVDIDERSLH